VSFTVRLTTDAGVIEILDAYRISDLGDNIAVTCVGDRTRYPCDDVHDIEIVWVKA
jgi:hypothetical protein